MKKLLLILLISFSTLTFGHQITSEDYARCVKDPYLKATLEIENFKAQGLSKQQVIDSISSSVPLERRKTVVTLIDLVYEKQHLINAPVTVFMECLNKQ